MTMSWTQRLRLVMRFSSYEFLESCYLLFGQLVTILLGDRLKGFLLVCLCFDLPYRLVHDVLDGSGDRFGPLVNFAVVNKLLLLGDGVLDFVRRRNRSVDSDSEHGKSSSDG